MNRCINCHGRFGSKDDGLCHICRSEIWSMITFTTMGLMIADMILHAPEVTAIAGVTSAYERNSG